MAVRTGNEALRSSTVPGDGTIVNRLLNTVSRYKIVDANTYKDLNLQEAIRIFNQTGRPL